MEEVLTEEKIKEELSLFSGWKIDPDKIEKVFEFNDFSGSIDFVNKVASVAERANHHPEIDIDYNKVEIELTTHSASGVTEKDINLAKEIENI